MCRGHSCPRHKDEFGFVLPSKTMTSHVGYWLRDPLFLLCLTAGLLAFVVQSGELGTADTMHRLQTTHWLWTSQPQVFPNEYPEFGLHGRDGRIFSWYGIGQSLLMLPADLIGTWISHWNIFAGYEDDPAIRSIFVSYTTNILINVLTALIAFRFLRQLKFGERESIWGVLALLFCTTHLHYTQNMQENNYIMLLTLAGFSYQYEWLRNGSNWALWVGSAALGLNLLTRVTTGLDVLAAGFFLLAVLWLERVRGQQLLQHAIAYCKVAVPVYILFGIIERCYNFYRFGSWTGTYIPIFAREQKLQDPTLPSNFPWSTPFHEGVLGALFKPEKSIFLFDPLLVLALILFVVLWKRLGNEVRAYIVTALLLLVGYISFYARYTYWAGDFSWGDRYVSTAVQMVAMLAVPLLCLCGAGTPARLPRLTKISGQECQFHILGFGDWESFSSPPVLSFRLPPSHSGCRSKSTRWKHSAIRHLWLPCGSRTSSPSRSARWTPGDSTRKPWARTSGTTSTSPRGTFSPFCCAASGLLRAGLSMLCFCFGE